MKMKQKSAILTITDGKICQNYIPDMIHMQRSSKMIKNLDAVIKTEDISLPFFSSFFHLAYCLDVKDWQIRGTEKIEIIAIWKAQIQKELHSELKLIVDEPNPQVHLRDHLKNQHVLYVL